MPFSILSRALLTAALSTFLAAQQPAADASKARQQAEAALQAKDYTAAAAAFRKVTAADPADGLAWMQLGYSLHAAGKLDEALPAHLKATEFPRVAAIASYNVACVHALKGAPDEAFPWLDKAVAAGFTDVDQLRGDSDLTSLRTDPRWAKLEQAMAAKAASTPARVMAFAQSVERKNTRAAWFAGRRGAPQLAIDYTPIAWKAEYEAAIASGAHKGEKWRFGGDFWTTLDTSIDVQLGGVAVPAGYYYLTLEQRDAGSYVLAAHDAAAVKKQKLDAFQAARLKGGIEIPMQHASGDATANQLAIDLSMDEGAKSAGTLTVRFGGHTLSAPFTVAIE